MNSSDFQKWGYLEFHPQNSKSPRRYLLNVGVNTIGTSFLSDIRIKKKNQNLEPVSCVIDVKENGLATIENKCKYPILLNGAKMNRIQTLKNCDKFVVAGKEFCYVNDAALLTNLQDSAKTKKRQTVMPSFKMKTTSQIPIASKSVVTRKSLTAKKVKKEMAPRFSLRNSLNKKRNHSSTWETTPNIITGKTFLPSSSMKKTNSLSVSVCRSLFLKNNGDISSKKIRISANSVSSLLPSNSFTPQLEAPSKLSSPRGTKRSRTSSADSTIKVYKRRKRSEKLFLNLSISQDIQTVSDESEPSFESISPDSPLYEFLPSRQSQKSPMNNSLEVRGLDKLLRSCNTKKSPNDLTNVQGVKKISETPKARKSPLKDLMDVSGAKKTLATFKNQKLLLNDLTDVKSVEKMLQTPKPQKSPLNDLTQVEGVKQLLKTTAPKVQKSPLNDLSSVRGIKELLKTPKVQKSPLNDLTDVRGVKKILKTPKVQKSPQNDLRNVSGVKKMMKTPKAQKSPLNDLNNVSGIKQLFQTPKVQKSPKNDLRNVVAVKRLLKTPKPQKSPKNDLTDVRGVKKILKTPKMQKSPKNDLTDLRGVKKLIKTPKIQKSPKNDLTDVRGVKKILKTPKMQKSPKNDLTDVRGVKKLLKTPKIQKSPKNDLTDVRGVKKILKIPKTQKSPKNDLTDIKGVKELLRTPRIQKSPRNDLTDVVGVKKMFTSPKVQKSPSNDLTDVRGVKKLMKSPGIQKSPLNDLSDLRGVKRLMKSPKIYKSPQNDLSDLEGVKELMSISKIDESLNNSLEVCNELLSNSDANKQFIGNAKVPKRRVKKRSSSVTEEVQSSATPNLQKTSTADDQTSQRGRRIRRKNFDDDYVASPKQKLSKVSQKQTTFNDSKKTVQEQISVDGDVCSSNLKNSEEIEMPQKRNVRGRRAKTTQENQELSNADSSSQKVDQEIGTIEKRSARGRKKEVQEIEEKVSVTSIDTSDPNLEKLDEIEVLQKRNMRGRKRNIAEEQIEAPKGKGNARSRKNAAKAIKIVDSSGAEKPAEIENSNLEEFAELPKKRNVRGRKKNVIEENKEEEKRSVRGRRKNVVGHIASPERKSWTEEAIVNNDESNQKTNKRRSDNASLNSKISDLEVKEESNQKRTGRGRKKIEKQPDVESIQEEKEVATRGRKRVDPVTTTQEKRSTNRTLKRKQQDTTVNEYLSSSVGKGKKARSAKVNNEELESVETEDASNNIKKTRRGRSAKQTEENDEIDTSKVLKTYNTRRQGRK